MREGLSGDLFTIFLQAIYVTTNSVLGHLQSLALGSSVGNKPR